MINFDFWLKIFLAGYGACLASPTLFLWKTSLQV